MVIVIVMVIEIVIVIVMVIAGPVKDGLRRGRVAPAEGRV